MVTAMIRWIALPAAFRDVEVDVVDVLEARVPGRLAHGPVMTPASPLIGSGG
jgi:hypothetical protein